MTGPSPTPTDADLETVLSKLAKDPAYHLSASESLILGYAVDAGRLTFEEADDDVS